MTTVLLRRARCASVNSRPFSPLWNDQSGLEIVLEGAEFYSRYDKADPRQLLLEIRSGRNWSFQIAHGLLSGDPLLNGAATDETGALMRERQCMTHSHQARCMMPATLENPASVELDGPAATLLMPLWARSQEALAPDGILHDQMAVRIVQALQFDFATFAEQRVPTADYCLRASIIDQLVRQHIAQHPAASIVEFGVGLDARFERLDNGRIRWTEIDLPEVMQLRKKFFAEEPRRRMLSGSLRDDQWLTKISQSAEHPPLFVAEGVFYFLTADEVRQLFTRLADCFPGSKLIFDAQSPLFLRVSNWRHPLRTSRLSFSVGRQAAEIASWDPRFQVEKYVGFGDSPYYDHARRRLSLLKRLAISLPAVTRDMFKIVQVGFGQKAGNS